VTLPRTASALLVIAAVALAANARAALWVSPGGDDGNPGTEEQPLRTIARARDLVRTLNRDMRDDITVFIAGAHYLDRPLVLGPEDSGTNGYNIVYTAAPGEHPVVSGGVLVTGWVLADASRNLWYAPAPEGLDDARALYVNGSPVRKTRGRLLAAFSRNAEGASASAPDPRGQWRNPADVTFTAPGEGAVWSERSAAAPPIVENAFELLGTPGEWYLDRPAHRFYYTPRASETMSRVGAVAVRAQALIEARGTKERPIVGLIFKGIRFEYAAAPAAQEAAPGGTAAGGPPAAAVGFAFAGGVQLLEDDFLHMDTPALDIGPAVEGATVDGCAFADISGPAVRVSYAAQVRIAESRLSYIATSGARDGAIDVDHSRDVSIEHDQIDHFSLAGILPTDEPAASLEEASNLISRPMIELHGAGQERQPKAPDTGAGVPPDYSSLVAEQFSSPTTPRPPECVSAEAEDKSAYVTWIPPCLDGGSPVTGYSVGASTGARITVSAADFQAKGYVAFSGLENGRPVTFTVTAATAQGESPQSLPTAPVTPTHRRRPRPPAAPAAVSITTGKAGSDIQLTPPPGDGGSPVVSYSITASPSGTRIVLEGLDVIHADAAHPLKRRIEGISLVGATSVSVAARNSAGEGEPAVLVMQK
jgi:hypothetical protein